MSSVNIQLDPVALREATTQALMGVLTPEVREEILRKAIVSLLNPGTNSWDRGKSPIEQAFDNAVTQIAREEAIRMVKEDPALQANVQSLLRKTADLMLNTDQDKLAQRMADAFLESIRMN